MQKPGCFPLIDRIDHGFTVMAGAVDCKKDTAILHGPTGREPEYCALLSIILEKCIGYRTLPQKTGVSSRITPMAQGDTMQKPHPIVFGETLFDCFSDGSAVLGGAPFNVAWHLQGFGLAPVVIGRVGMDQRGRDILQSMSRWGMTTAFMQNDPDHPTGSVEITTHNGEPLFRINPDQAYGHIEMPAQELPSEVPLVYHGTLAVWNSAAREVLDALKDRFNAPVFVDVNLRSPWWDNEDVHSLVADATWVKMNVEELQLLFPDHEDENRRVQELYNRYAVEVFILTKGSEGAKFYLRNGTTRHVRPAERLEVIDTVGAGDAFSAVCIVGYIHGWDIEKTLVHAQEFASKIVTKRGAVMQDPAAYAELLNRWLQNV